MGTAASVVWTLSAVSDDTDRLLFLSVPCWSGLIQLLFCGFARSLDSTFGFLGEDSGDVYLILTPFRWKRVHCVDYGDWLDLAPHTPRPQVTGFSHLLSVHRLVEIAHAAGRTADADKYAIISILNAPS